MQAMVCDNCGVAKPPAECDGWLSIAQLAVTTPVELLEYMRNGGGSKGPWHLCSADCAVSFLRNDRRGMAELLRDEGGAS